MNQQDTRNLINFHYWARNRMLDAVELLPEEQFTKEVGGSFGSVRNTIVHTYSTMLRQLGFAPPKGTDLITFYRENP